MRSREEIDRDLNALHALAASRRSAISDPVLLGLRPSGLDWLDDEELNRYTELLAERHPYTAEENSPERARARCEAKRALRRAGKL